MSLGIRLWQTRQRLGVRAACRRFGWVVGLRMTLDDGARPPACESGAKVTALQDAAAPALDNRSGICVAQEDPSDLSMRGLLRPSH